MKPTLRFFLRPILAIACLAAVLLTNNCLHADTIILKNGTRYQGRVLKDEGDSYLLEIQVTRSIKDERRVLKADIEKIEKSNPITEDFKPLANLDDTPDLLDEAGYQARIDRLDKFLAIKEYKFSKPYKAAREIAGRLNAERKVIAKGGVKINGHLITSSQRMADAVTIDSEILFAKMHKAAATGRFLSALRTFDSIGKRFPQTATEKKATDLARKVFVAARKKFTLSLNSLDKRLKERESGLQRMTPADRTRTEAVISERQLKFKSKIAKERQDGIKWLTIDYFDRQSLQGTLRRIDSESQRLDRPPYNRLKKAPDVAYREAWKALPDADEKQRKTILSEFKQLNLPDEKYLKQLEERAADEPTPAPAPEKPAAK